MDQQLSVGGPERGRSLSVSRVTTSVLCLLQELGYVDLLELEEVEAGILTANKKGEEERASEWPGCWRGLRQVLLPWSWCTAPSCNPPVPGLSRSAAGRQPHQRRRPPRDAG